ncbi:MAG: hypothetical protein ABW133_12620 [Polyangiaceae bacterium]
MLEILTTDEFAAWYASLADGPAEEVATALEMIEKLGPARPAPGSSEWLLWYEDPSAPEVVLLDDWTAFHASTQSMVDELEKPGFSAKLAALSSDEASKVMLAIDALKTGTAARRRGLSMVSAAIASRYGQPSDPFAALREAYRTVATVTGLNVSDHAVHSSALRELSVRSAATRCRLLYGVDRAREVALVVLGENLDRCFYGDAVRRAERVWKEFLLERSEPQRAASR